MLYAQHEFEYGDETDHLNEVFFQNGKYNTPRQKYNNNTQCFACGESTHWIRDCPHKTPTSPGRQPRSRNLNRQCYGCGDSMHWLKDCPYLRDVQSMIRNNNQNNNQNAQHNIHYSAEEKTPTGKKERTVFFQSSVKSDFQHSVEELLPPSVGETMNKAVLDCGANETVCGKEWYNSYFDSADAATQQEIQD